MEQNINNSLEEKLNELIRKSKEKMKGIDLL